MLLKEYISFVIQEKLQGNIQQEIFDLFKRAIHDIGTEEVAWFVKDQDWKGLTETILEIVEYGYKKINSVFMMLVKERRYDDICALLQHSMRTLLKVDAVCSSKQIEHFYSKNYI